MLIEQPLRPVNMARASTSAVTSKDRKGQSSMFETLPGEVRNQIYELCIYNALKRSKGSSWSRRNLIHHLPPETFEVSIFPQWYGKSRMHISYLGYLPLLFVNKQICREVASIVYSKVENLWIGGYIIQHQNQDPNLRWSMIYPLLMNPHLCQFTKSITIKLPSTRNDIENRYSNLRGFSVTGFGNLRCHPRFELVTSVIPGLVECLRTFKALSRLRVIITMQNTPQPPDFKMVLPLYDLCGNRTTVIFSDPKEYTMSNIHTNWWHHRENWDLAWKECLVQNGRV